MSTLKNCSFGVARGVFPCQLGIDFNVLALRFCSGRRHLLFATQELPGFKDF
jgi:hypothetical protein